MGESKVLMVSVYLIFRELIQSPWKMVFGSIIKWKKTHPQLKTQITRFVPVVFRCILNARKGKLP